MGLTRRIERLEATLPPPPADPAGDGDADGEGARRWWEDAPPAARTYAEALDGEAGAAGVPAGDLDALDAWVAARHPLFTAVFRAVLDPWWGGWPVTTRQVQRDLLSEARARLMAHRPERYGDRDGQVIGWTAAEHYDAAADRSGARWVAAWRAQGTTNAETRALAGLHAAELALLDADEVTA